ncbi:hypothetical protein YK48G_15960 [Lentilactobacillus fungorum]|uniref:Pyridoxamine 5'-phosphate oxidase putative domain-containing protein n=1 Tax=Lentilactobacillus fungorum TaxID=2201250 RepID=A0ABQ3W1J1_9LACO|nr:hypothetical protein YK48G_15960 [Lentilactobacillus fungorum]
MKNNFENVYLSKQTGLLNHKGYLMYTGQTSTIIIHSNKYTYSFLNLHKNPNITIFCINQLDICPKSSYLYTSKALAACIT